MSELVTDGALKYLFENIGVERFPKDPLNPDTWTKERSSIKDN